jgi:hypothetical protein
VEYRQRRLKGPGCATACPSLRRTHTEGRSIGFAVLDSGGSRECDLDVRACTDFYMHVLPPGHATMWRPQRRLSTTVADAYAYPATSRHRSWLRGPRRAGTVELATQEQLLLRYAPNVGTVLGPSPLCVMTSLFFRHTAPRQQLLTSCSARIALSFALLPPSCKCFEKFAQKHAVDRRITDIQGPSRGPSHW